MSGTIKDGACSKGSWNQLEGGGDGNGGKLGKGPKNIICELMGLNFCGQKLRKHVRTANYFFVSNILDQLFLAVDQ